MNCHRRPIDSLRRRRHPSSSAEDGGGGRRVCENEKLRGQGEGTNEVGCGWAGIEQEQNPLLEASCPRENQIFVLRGYISNLFMV